MVYKNRWNGPRWAKFSDFLKDLAWDLDLVIEIEIDKGIIRESGRYVVEGDEESIKKFRRMISSAIEAYHNI